MKPVGTIVTLLAIVAIAGGLFYALGGDSGIDGLTIEIPSRADFIGQTDQNASQSIFCNLKQTVSVYDHQGKKIDEINSQFLSGSPIFTGELTGRGSNALISHFTSEPKIFCETGSSSFNDITIQSSTLTLTAFISDDTGRLVQTFQKTQPTKEVKFDTGANPEHVLTAFGVSEQNIADAIVDYKTFNSRVDFKISGVLKAHYTNYPNVSQMLIPIGTEDIKVIYSVTQHISDNPTCPTGQEWNSFELACIDIGDKDTDGDGIFDSADKCISQSENFNGFEDTDGCPDVNPEPVVAPEEPKEDTTCEEGQEKVDDVCKVIDPNQVGTDDPQSPATPEETANAETELLKGKIDTDISIVFKDGSRESLLTSQIQPNGLGTISLNSVVGGFEGKKKDEIRQIELRPYFTFDTLEQGRKVTLITSDVSVEPTLRINSANQEMPSSKLTNWVTTTGKDFLGGKINGIPLGERFISSSEILAEAVNDGGLTQGQQENVDLTIELGGTFTVTYNNDVTKTIAINNHLVTFPNWEVTKSTTVVADPKCEELGFEVIIEAGSGDVTCNDPKQDPNAQTCFTPQRPSGFECSQEWIDQNCIDNDPKQCSEPDVQGCESNNTCTPEIVKQCANGDILPIEATCPDGSQGTIKDIQIINGQICIFENGNLVQCVDNGSQGGSSTDNTFLLLAGGAILLVGIIALIAKRRG